MAYHYNRWSVRREGSTVAESVSRENIAIIAELSHGRLDMMPIERTVSIVNSEQPRTGDSDMAATQAQIDALRLATAVLSDRRDDIEDDRETRDELHAATCHLEDIIDELLSSE